MRPSHTGRARLRGAIERPMFAFAALLISTASAAPPIGQPLAPAITLPMRDTAAAAMTSEAVSDAAFWASADVTPYTGELYDQIRLRPLEEGYFTMVTGEGDEDFLHEVVVDTAWRLQDRLPPIEDGALAIEILGQGVDARSGAPYIDTLFCLDFTLFYGVYIQRTYRLDQGGRTFVFFETLREGGVDPAAWQSYQPKVTEVLSGVERRWVFNKMVEVEEVFGTFIVEPGEQHTTRISFLVRLRFGEDAGMMARLGTELPPVLRAGLQSGFVNCVKIAHTEQRARQGSVAK